MTTMVLTPHTGSKVGAAAAAGERLTATRAELPALAELGHREQLLVAVWLVSLRSARTRRAYLGDLAAWLAWLGQRGWDPLGVGRVQVDIWVRAHTEAGAMPATIRRRLSALSSWYRCPASARSRKRVGTPRGWTHRRTRAPPSPSPRCDVSACCPADMCLTDSPSWRAPGKCQRPSLRTPDGDYPR
jgi:Phage integrase, N-terminal SAM-like domain